ncbi:hypothetical protein CapIbe_011357 [Capra ibex]
MRLGRGRSEGQAGGVACPSVRPRVWGAAALAGHAWGLPVAVGTGGRARSAPEAARSEEDSRGDDSGSEPGATGRGTRLKLGSSIAPGSCALPWRSPGVICQNRRCSSCHWDLSIIKDQLNVSHTDQAAGHLRAASSAALSMSQGPPRGRVPCAREGDSHPAGTGHSSWSPPARAPDSCLASMGLLEFGPGFSSAACLLPLWSAAPNLPLGMEESVPPREKASFCSDVQCSAPGPNLKGCSGRRLQLPMELVLSATALFQLPASSPLQI